MFVLTEGVTEVAKALVISLGVGAAITPVLIRLLRRLGAFQAIRKEGVAAHERKRGTPTLGGIGILLSLTAGSLLAAGSSPTVRVLVLVTAAFGMIGILDDGIKIVTGDSRGLTPLQKMTAQLVVTGTFLFYVTREMPGALCWRIPFLDGATLRLEGLAGGALFFLTMLGTVNGVNLTDGVDALATSVTILVAACFGVLGVVQGSPAAVVMAGTVGALLAFLPHNSHPARIFMGDAGSLALGALLAAGSILMGLPLFILIAGFVYLLETVSVIIQVAYFRLTGGRRFFKMAPFHHHLELSGWSENRVVMTFSLLTAALCLALCLWGL